MKTTKPCWYGFFGTCGALAALLAVPAPSIKGAPADDTGLYLRGDIGPNFLPGPTAEPGGGTSGLDPGFRLDGAVGYSFNSWVAAEFETGFLYNAFSNDPRNSWLGQVPLMGSMVVRYQNPSHWIPYAGFGLGGVIGTVNSDAGDSMDEVFAWQLLVGVRYQLNEALAIDAGYRYLGTSDQHYNVGGPFTLTDVHNHMIGVSVHWKF